MEKTLARQQTLARWQAILDGIGRRDTIDLVTELNAVSELCDLASEEAGEEAGDPLKRCEHCLVFNSGQECADVRWRITQSLLDGEQEAARAAVMAVVARIVAARSSETS